MNKIVPPGYAVAPAEIRRLTEELRKARAKELEGAPERDRARIEKEIAKEVSRLLKPRCKHPFGALW